MKLIRKKKPVYPIRPELRSYLIEYEREQKLPVEYDDLLRFTGSVALYDRHNVDTLWETVFYQQSDMMHIYASLKHTYAILKVGGMKEAPDHLMVDRIDFCVYGNTQPFRIRIVNKLNDNFDYFYVKRADASRVYGLELEHILSPNRISFFTCGNTLIEEHIAGIPGDKFIEKYLPNPELNKSRLAKEFVKFNERCMARLLGDMHSGNYLIEVVPDFDDVYYRLRAIDFDRQCYDGDLKVYMPQFYKENYPIVKICMDIITPETAKQYRNEERAIMAARMKQARYRIHELGNAVMHDRLSTPENVKKLRHELAEYYADNSFAKCKSMGELVRTSLRLLMKNT